MTALDQLFRSVGSDPLLGSLVEADQVVLRHQEEVAVAGPLDDLRVERDGARQVVVDQLLKLLHVLHHVRAFDVIHRQLTRWLSRRDGVERDEDVAPARRRVRVRDSEQRLASPLGASAVGILGPSVGISAQREDVGVADLRVGPAQALGHLPIGHNAQPSLGDVVGGTEIHDRAFCPVVDVHQPVARLRGDDRGVRGRRIAAAGVLRSPNPVHSGDEVVRLH